MCLGSFRQLLWWELGIVVMWCGWDRSSPSASFSMKMLLSNSWKDEYTSVTINLSDPWRVWFLMITISHLRYHHVYCLLHPPISFRTLIYNWDSSEVREGQTLRYWRGIILLSCPLWPLSLPTGMLLVRAGKPWQLLEGKPKEENPEGIVRPSSLWKQT